MRVAYVSCSDIKGSKKFDDLICVVNVIVTFTKFHLCIEAVNETENKLVIRSLGSTHSRDSGTYGPDEKAKEVFKTGGKIDKEKRGYFGLSSTLTFPCSDFARPTTLCDWLAKLAPLFQPMRGKSKPVVTCSHAFSRA